MQPDFCIDFLNRKCQLTKRTCRNIHVSYEHREVLKKVCIKFLNGKCDSKNCFEHKTLKQLKIPTPDTYYANAEIEDYTDARFCRNWVLYHKCKPNCTDVHPINKDILVMRKCCLDFLLDGHCTTPSCPKPHKAYADIDIWPPSAYPNKYPKTEICIDWLNGKCKDSDADCKWIHVEKNHIKILTKNSNHEEKMSSNAFFTKMLRLHVGCSIREYEYKFPPVSPMVEDPHKSSAPPTNGTTPVPKEAVAATSPSPSQQQPSAKVATKDQKSIQPGQKETSSPPLMHHQPHSLPQPNGKSVNGHVSPKENHIAAQPAIVSPVVPPASAEPTMPIDQVLLKIISTCMEMRQLWLSEHEHKANAEAELETLKHALTEQATIVRNEEERLVKYFFDSLMGEEYLRHASEAVPETQSILLGPLKEAAALIEKYKRTAPVVANKYIAHPVTDLISKNRAETLVQNLRAFMRQFNIDGFPQAVQDVASNRGDVESQIGVVEKTLEDLQSQKTAIRQKYQFLNTKEPLQCLNLSELEMLETHIKNESEQILSTIATSIYCIVCKVNLRIIAVLPCGHLYYCEECANKIAECASCGTPIQYRAYIKR